jgi:hypothetical protein
VVSTNGQWVVRISGIATGTTFHQGDFDVTVDTGGIGSIELPRWAVDLYFAQFSGTTWDESWRTYRYPCATALTDLVFGVGDDYKGVIKKEKLRWAIVDATKDICVSYIIAGRGEGLGWNKVFIQNQFLIFDYGNRRLGFANKDVL